MRIAERLARLEGRATNFSWAAMCTANDRRCRRQAYQKALQLAEMLGVAVDLREPSAPDPAALAAFDRKYGEAMRADVPAVWEKLKRAAGVQSEGDAGGQLSPAEQEQLCRYMLDSYMQWLQEPEREYRMVA